MAQMSNIGGDHSLASRAYEELTDYLAEGGFPAGHRLVETELADMLGVSRGPIRQALQKLAAEGWVEIRPRAGAYVAHRDRKAAEDFFSVRHLLEVKVAGLAAQRRTDDDMRRLRELLTSAEALSSELRGGERDARTFHRDTSVRFHETMALASHNATLCDVLGVLVRKTRWYFAPGVLKHSDRAWTEHEQLVDAVERQDVDLSRRLMDRHMDNTLSTYLENMA